MEVMDGGRIGLWKSLIVEAADCESFGMWTFTIMDALDRLDCGSSEQWKLWIVEELDR